MAEPPPKSDQAFRTIGELATDLGVPQHILRYWETRFPQLRPLQRAGNRRYYRQADVALAHRIHKLLHEDGYTIRGVQQLLAGGGADGEGLDGLPRRSGSGAPKGRLRAVRKKLKDALDESGG